MQSLLANLDYVINELGLDELETNSLVWKASKKLNITPRQVLQIFVSVVALMLLLILIKLADIILLFIVGIVYPAYETVKVRNSTLGFEKGARLWLLYWVCYGIFASLHTLFKVLLTELPFIHILESGVLIWLYHSKTLGVELINSKIFAPLLKKYGKSVEKQLHQVKETLQKKTS